MNHSKLVKGLTLLIFVVLITLFLLYRTGKFDTYLTNSESFLQAIPTSSNQSDTSKPKMDSSQKLMMSSSKVLILTDKRTRFSDSIKNTLKSDTFRLKEQVIMSSSKSAIIFKPPTANKRNLDSLKLDTAKN